MYMYRVGQGYDVHKLTAERELILGGVLIEHSKGLAAHSDGDVLAHAIIDALLGAAALGDIGDNFPDTDPRYKNINSMLLLEKTGILLESKGYTIVNVDSTIVAQEPKLQKYRKIMAENIANALKIPADSVSVKATTEEGLGFTGHQEGIAAHGVCMIKA